MKSVIKDIVFPPRCALCDKVVTPSGGYICDSCRPLRPYVKEPRCYKCGKEIASPEVEFCLDCSRRKRDYIQGFPVFNYIPPVSDSIAMFKYSDRQEYALFYGEEIVQRFGKRFKDLGINLLVPVPIHKKKYLKRGYNQAELVAEAVGNKLGIQVVPDLIIRSEKTSPQKELSPDARERNLKNAFVLNEKCAFMRGLKDLNGSLDFGRVINILLVDDIYTTGATIEACSHVLKSMGKTVDMPSEMIIVNVYYTSVAIGKV